MNSLGSARIAWLSDGRQELQPEQRECREDRPRWSGRSGPRGRSAPASEPPRPERCKHGRDPAAFGEAVDAGCLQPRRSSRPMSRVMQQPDEQQRERAGQPREEGAEGLSGLAENGGRQQAS